MYPELLYINNISFIYSECTVHYPVRKDIIAVRWRIAVWWWKIRENMVHIKSKEHTIKATAYLHPSTLRHRKVGNSV